MEDIREGRCPVCRHHEVIEGRPERFEEVLDSKAPPSAVTHQRLERWTVSYSDRSKPEGVLSTYTCRSCGFTQIYAARPADIRIGPEFRTRLIAGVRSDEPFR